MVMNLFKLAALTAISLLLSVSCVKEEGSNNPGNNTETGSGTTPGTDPGKDPGTDPGTNPVAEFKLSKHGADTPILKNDIVDMLWYEFDIKWAFYIDIESSIEWEIVNLPEWLKSKVKNVSKNQYEVDLVADLAQLPVEGDKTTVSFKKKENDETVFSFELRLPSSEGIVNPIYFRKSIDFSENGLLTSPTEDSDRIYSGTVVSVEGTELYAVAKSGNTMVVVADQEGTIEGWCHITVQEPWKAGGDKIQSIKYGFSVDANTDDTRAASIVAVPKSLRSDSFNPASDLFTSDKSALRSDLTIVSTITQQGKPFSDITVSGCEFRPIETEGGAYKEGEVYQFLRADIMDGRPVYVLNFNEKNGSLTARYNGGNVFAGYQDLAGNSLKSTEVFAPMTRPDETNKALFNLSSISERIGSGPQRFLLSLWGDDYKTAERPRAFIYVVYNTGN